VEIKEAAESGMPVQSAIVDFIEQLKQGLETGNHVPTANGGSESVLACRHETGNAIVTSADHRGWFVGHFMLQTDPLHRASSVEVKWGSHRAGEGEDDWSMNRSATTLSLLVHGRDRIVFPDEDVVLQRAGDYAIWGPGTPHKWRAEEDCLVITIRWPSVADDLLVLSDAELDAYLSAVAR
jgi:hypothetical protein